MRQLTVMVIDDSELVLSVVESFLDAAGYRVVTRKMALGTRAAILRERPDVILLDVNMPLLDGAELCGAIRSHTAMRGSCIVLHSDIPETELRAIAARAGANGYIRKTHDRAEFIRRFQPWVASALESRPRAFLHGGYLLVACSAALQARLRRELVRYGEVEYTDSGAEVIRRVCAVDAPEAIVLGSGITDLPWEDVYRRALRRDPDYASRVLLVDEGGAPSAIPVEFAWAPEQPTGRLEEILRRVRPER